MKKSLLALFVLLGFFETAFATHEADHRYVLSGYVRDTNGVPIPAATVLLEHKGGEKKSVKTNDQGYYEVLFHLHNNNLGDEIILKFGETTKKHKVKFDPDDQFTNRGGEIDFGAPGKDEAKIWIYLTGGTIGLFGFLLYLGFFRKKKVHKQDFAGKKRKKKR